MITFNAKHPVVLLLLLVLAVAIPSLARAESGQTFETPGATIYYETIGSGSAPPLVIVNGGPGFDHTYLLPTTAWDLVAKTRRVVFYDQRGTGRSTGTHPNQSFTLKDQIDDLDALRAHLGLERMDLMGHSWGGFVVMAYGAVHPDRIAHLLIVDSAAPKIKDTMFLFSSVFPERTEHQDALGLADDLGDPNAHAASLHDYVSMLFYSPEHRDAYLPKLSPTAENREVNKAQIADAEKYDLNAGLPAFHFPVLVATGRFDMNVAAQVAFKIHQAIAGSRFVVFEHRAPAFCRGAGDLRADG